MICRITYVIQIKNVGNLDIEFTIYKMVPVSVADTGVFVLSRF